MAFSECLYFFVDDDQFTLLVFDRQIYFVEFIAFFFLVRFALKYFQNGNLLVESNGKKAFEYYEVGFVPEWFFLMTQSK